MNAIEVTGMKDAISAACCPEIVSHVGRILDEMQRQQRAAMLTAMEGIGSAITLPSLDPLLGTTLKAEMFRELRFPRPLSRKVAGPFRAVSPAGAGGARIN